MLTGSHAECTPHQSSKSSEDLQINDRQVNFSLEQGLFERCS